jgi:hypothetical protein
MDQSGNRTYRPSHNVHWPQNLNYRRLLWIVALATVAGLVLYATIAVTLQLQNVSLVPEQLL